MCSISCVEDAVMERYLMHLSDAIEIAILVTNKAFHKMTAKAVLRYGARITSLIITLRKTGNSANTVRHGT